MIGNGTELEQVLHRKAAVGQEGLVLSSPCTAFTRPSRSIHHGDVSGANGRETFSLGPRDPKHFGRAE